MSVDQTTNTNSAITPEQLFERLVNLFHEQNTLSEDIKSLLAQVKEEGVIDNAQAIKAAAKLKADASEGTWQEKVDAIKNVLDSVE